MVIKLVKKPELKAEVICQSLAVAGTTATLAHPIQISSSQVHTKISK